MGILPKGGADQDGFARAVAALTAAVGGSDDLCGPFLAAVPVSGAVISTLGNPLGTQTVCATSELAARVDEIQIDFGEGPCWDARRTGRLVSIPDLASEVGGEWPNIRTELRELGIGSIHAFPLAVGPLTVGSVDIYSMVASTLHPLEVANVTSLSAIAARQVLRRAQEDAESSDEQMPGGPYSRREVHQASGMVAAQLNITVDDALVVLRGHAFAEGTSVRDVAEEVVGRRLDFGV